MKPSLALRALVASSLLLCGAAHAVPAPPFPIELRHADGTRFAARMLGDEHLSWFEDQAGFAIAWDERSGSWHLAQRGADGALVPGPHRLDSVDPARLGLRPHLQPGPAAIDAAHRRRALTRSPDRAPPKGTVRNLVLLVKFRNQTTRWSREEFEQVFNAESDSVRAYYREISDGALDLVSTVVDWIELPEDDSFYAWNGRNQTGDPSRMIFDAVTHLNAEGFDFTVFDADHDGRIDAVDVIHSGGSYETTGHPNYIHSHYAPLAWNAFTTHDGVRIWAYHTEAELGPDNASTTQIGVIAHETAHFFGLPDLYDYGYDSGGLGAWCLMSGGSWSGPGSNGQSPSHPSAWARLELGLVAPRRIDSGSAEVRLAPTEQQPGAVLLSAGMPAKQYFLLENRQRIGFDSYLPGEGLLVFHVDESRGGNDDQSRYLVDLEQADGRRDLNLYAYGHGDATDPFPLKSIDAFTPATSPGSVGYGSNNGSNWVTRIAREGREVTFHVEVRPPGADGAACSSGFECERGYCVDGVCCQSACEGPCLTCSQAGGASADGVCSPREGRACDDGNPCTIEDACREGRCVGGAAKPCLPIDSCHGAGVCEIGTGRCTAPRLADGTSCDDRDPCTWGETCSAGYCAAGAPVACEPAGECRLAPTCQPGSAGCTAAPAPDGTACSGGECRAGVCEPKRCGCSATGSGAPALGLIALLGALRRHSRRISRTNG